MSTSLRGFTNGKVLPGKRAEFTIEREDGQALTVSCDTAELQDVMQFIAGLAKFASERQDFGPGPQPNMPYLAPIEITGIGVTQGLNHQPVLVVNLGGFALAFAVPNSDLVKTADEFARVARAMSAPMDRKN